MNQDQVKERLLRLDEDVEEFAVVFTGKKSKKAHGLYYPDSREIIIHNHNFDDDNQLMYTAIHEFAHHVHFTRSPVPVGNRAHTIEFRNILHDLLERAEELGVYRNIFRTNPEFMALTYRLRRDFLGANGELMKRFGAALLEAQQLCEKYNARFEDYVERVLSLNTRSANTIIKTHTYDITPSIGYDNMATVAGIADPDKRQEAEEAFAGGRSPDRVKAMLRQSSEGTGEEPIERLRKEKRRLERTIQSLQDKLHNVEERLERYDTYAQPGEGGTISSFRG
ncbi:MAG: hypothetical protein ACLFPO_01990 [Spirochaetaceae bacterium]